MKNTIFLFLLFLLIPIITKSQDIEQIIKSDPLKVSGSLNFSANGYHAQGIEQRRQPFTWVASGNLGIAILGYNVPLSFSYSNRKATYKQPFNRLSLSPSYKWVKTYIGYSAMEFSKYSLAGHQFFGGGLELTPGKWYLGFMYGRLNEAKPLMNDTIPNPDGAYKRMAYGIKTAYLGQNSQYGISVFKAADELSSQSEVLENQEVKPMENLITSFNFKQKVLQHLFLEAEIAHSVLTTDIRTNETTNLNNNETFGFIMQTHTSTNASNAFNTGLTFEAGNFAIQARFEQVGAGYQSLGAYYAQNNFRNYTLAPSISFISGKVNVSGNFGLQQENLNKADGILTKRWVGAVNSSVAVIKNWNIGFSYSNFTNFTKEKPLQDPFYKNEFDTLSFYQITQNATANFNYQFGNKNKPMIINGNFSYQKTKDNASHDSISTDVDVYTANLMYIFSIPQTGWAMQSGVNAFWNIMENNKQKTVGPMLGINRSFMKSTIRCGFTASLNQMWQADSMASKIVASNFSLSYNPKSNKKGKSAEKEKVQEKGTNKAKNKSSFTFNAGWVKRFPVSELIKKSNEFSFVIRYGYSF